MFNVSLKLVIVSVCMLTTNLLLAQKQGDFWFFGDGAGLDFSNGEPQSNSDGATSFIGCPACHAEGTAVIADSTGTLLFYIDGNKVWNSNHEVMPNGVGLLSNISSTQSALIVPQPGSNRFYYIFHTSDFSIQNLVFGFRYTKIDMCLDGGLGDVVQDEKNILLFENSTEKLTGVKHANGEDYWILGHAFESDAFYAFHLSSFGIEETVICNVGSIHTGNPGATIGQMKASPLGNKIALVNAQASPRIAEYFEFDNSTGIVSNPTYITGNPNWGYYGVSFSPDGSKLYIACTMNGNGIYQYDLEAGGGEAEAVNSSMTQVGFYHNFLGMQLANNGKIYVARSPFGFNDG